MAVHVRRYLRSGARRMSFAEAHPVWATLLGLGLAQLAFFAVILSGELMRLGAFSR